MVRIDPEPPEKRRVIAGAEKNHALVGIQIQVQARKIHPIGLQADFEMADFYQTTHLAQCLVVRDQRMDGAGVIQPNVRANVAVADGQTLLLQGVASFHRWRIILSKFFIGRLHHGISIASAAGVGGVSEDLLLVAALTGTIRYSRLLICPFFHSRGRTISMRLCWIPPGLTGPV